MHYVGLLSVSLSIYIYLSMSLPLFVKASFLKAYVSCIQLSKNWQVEGTSQCVQTTNPQICKQNPKYVVQFLEHMFRSIWVKWICVSYMTNSYFEYILAFVCVLLTCTNYSQSKDLHAFIDKAREFDVEYVNAM